MKPESKLATSDTDFAAAMMAQGARLDSWKPSPESSRRMTWFISGVEPEWVEHYRTGKDGIAAFIHSKKMLVNIAKTDERIR